MRANLGTGTFEITAGALAAMRDWLSDLEWVDLTPEELQHVDRYRVVRAVDRHYSGGVRQFLAAIA